MMKMKNRKKKFERILIKFRTMGWFSNDDIHVESAKSAVYLMVGSIKITYPSGLLTRWNMQSSPSTSHSQIRGLEW